MSSQATPPSGFVHLVLLSREGEDPFYLEIPIHIVNSLCLRPLKYLQYLGWCILGVSGTLADEKGVDITLDGELLDKGTYRYMLSGDGDNPLSHAVDLDVIKQRSQIPSESTSTHEDFCAKISERDYCCVWTGLPGAGMHIIPYSRGDEWLQLIIRNRTTYNDEEIASFTINDIRNGIFAQDGLHNHHLDPREVVVLKTPNDILDTTDIPGQAHRNVFFPGVSYPTYSRYTLQWLIVPEASKIVFQTFPNNNDATFKDHSFPKPADVLLHYNYGAAAVKQWGKNEGVLKNRPDLPRPAIPAPAPKDYT